MPAMETVRAMERMRAMEKTRAMVANRDRGHGPAHPGSASGAPRSTRSSCPFRAGIHSSSSGSFIRTPIPHFGQIHRRLSRSSSLQSFVLLEAVVRAVPCRTDPSCPLSRFRSLPSSVELEASIKPILHVCRLAFPGAPASWELPPRPGSGEAPLPPRRARPHRSIAAALPRSCAANPRSARVARSP